MIGNSKIFKSMLRIAYKAAPTSSTVLITGQTGTGKELVAEAIHKASKRPGHFVPINCGAIPGELLESELFGHKKGSFTNAFAEKVGRFELADQGTVFLDEIGEMEPRLQVKILRFLQDKKVEKVGDKKLKNIDVRVIAATNKDLVAEVKSGRFRKDLFYRLNVIPISVPPLKDRDNDISLLTKRFLKKYQNGRLLRVSQDVRNILKNHDWPGNVRELENLIERMCILSEGPEILPEDLPVEISRDFRKPQESQDSISLEGMQNLNLHEYVHKIERLLMREALDRTSGNKHKAARILGINRTTFIEKLKARRVTWN